MGGNAMAGAYFISAAMGFNGAWRLVTRGQVQLNYDALKMAFAIGKPNPESLIILLMVNTVACGAG